MDGCFEELTEILKKQGTSFIRTEAKAVTYAITLAKEMLGEEVKELHLLIDNDIFDEGPYVETEVIGETKNTKVFIEEDFIKIKKILRCSELVSSKYEIAIKLK